MPSHPRFRINTAKVALENFDGEVVIINFDSGTYYSLDQSGAAILALIERRLTQPEIIAEVQARYEGDSEVVAQAVSNFISDLSRENLIIPDSAPAPDHTPEPASPVERPAFVAPTFSIYTDMQELLLLDPIHDVDANGWPNVSPELAAKR